VRRAAVRGLGLLHGTACLGDAWWLFRMGTCSLGWPRHRCCECYELCAVALWLFLVGRGTCRARRAAVPSRRVLRRVQSLRDRSGQRRRASMALLYWRGIWLRGNIRVRAAGASPAVSAASEPCEGVLCARGASAGYLAGRTGAAMTCHIYKHFCASAAALVT
jgi:hypothetical protein